MATRNTCTTSTSAAYVMPRTMVTAWAIVTGWLAGGMFLFWAVGSAIGAAFFDATAADIRWGLYHSGFAVAIAAPTMVLFDWFRVRASWGRLTIEQAGTGRVVVIPPHKIAATLTPWYADSGELSSVTAERLDRLQRWHMTGEPNPHLEAVLGLMVTPPRPR